METPQIYTLSKSPVLIGLNRVYFNVDLGHFRGAGIQNVDLQTEICDADNFVVKLRCI